jgi:hypothetical protein
MEKKEKRFPLGLKRLSPIAKSEDVKTSPGSGTDGPKPETDLATSGSTSKATSSSSSSNIKRGSAKSLKRNDFIPVTESHKHLAFSHARLSAGPPIQSSVKPVEAYGNTDKTDRFFYTSPDGDTYEAQSVLARNPDIKINPKTREMQVPAGVKAMEIYRTRKVLRGDKRGPWQMNINSSWNDSK